MRLSRIQRVTGVIATLVLLVPLVCGAQARSLVVSAMPSQPAKEQRIGLRERLGESAPERVRIGGEQGFPDDAADVVFAQDRRVEAVRHRKAD